jgi:hypothetical protein
VLVKVLFLLNVKNWGSKILEFSRSLRHLEIFGDLHDFFEFWEKASSKNVLGRKLKAIENRYAQTRTFLVRHLHKGDSVSLTRFLVDGNLNVCRFNF